MKTPIAAAVVLSFALCALAGAQENYKEKAFNADTADRFEATAESVRKEMEPGGRYQYVKAAERTKVDVALSDMSALFAEHHSVAEMNQDTKVHLFNDQELVNAILHQRDGDRVICKNESPIGSHRAVTKCRTYAQEVEARRGTNKQTQPRDQGSCSDSGASGTAGTLGGAPCLMRRTP